MTDPRATVLRYHEATNNSPESVAAGRPLDWANQPLPYKIYSTLEPIPLPTPIEPTGYPAIRALLEPAEPPPTVSPTIDLATIARLCVLSNGIIRVRRYPGGEIAFRAAGTTGALYHQELYLACTDLPDLEAGLYHFGAHDNALRRLRSGDYRNALVAATAGEPSIAHAPLVVIATSTFWRNASSCAWDFSASRILGDMRAWAATEYSRACSLSMYCGRLA